MVELTSHCTDNTAFVYHFFVVVLDACLVPLLSVTAARQRFFVRVAMA
jgi:hypothetical protein